MTGDPESGLPEGGAFLSAESPISVFDMLKIGVGPSSSHTLGPWRAAEAFVNRLIADGVIERVTSVEVELFGSLAKTGRGHGTSIALMMGLSGFDPVTCDVDRIPLFGSQVRLSGELVLGGRFPVAFDRDRDLRFDNDNALTTHPNAMTFTATLADGSVASQTSYSIGGGFVTHEDDHRSDGSNRQSDGTTLGNRSPCPFPIETAADLVRWSTEGDRSIADLVQANELTWRSAEQIDRDILDIRDAMLDCVFRGCQATGTLPGGLDVTRRAARLHDDLLGPASDHALATDWFDAVRGTPAGFDDTVAWISCFALAVNEENAAFGRVVTAPTNGAAGVIPAVMFHHLSRLGDGRASQREIDDESVRFLLIAAEVGAIFKKGSTISAALGGCQAEIGVSSAMAAAALTECLGGSVSQALMAAEIAMEHHLGLTCDPIGGLVQVPCIERNAIGAMKAITASRIARSSRPDLARVSLDAVVETMWATAQDMSAKYKETAEGGLATRIPVSVVEC